MSNLKTETMNILTEKRNVKLFNKNTKETHYTSERIAKDIVEDSQWIRKN